ncbi:glycosyltransferase family 4 protein [Denitrificimonas caeni]|uniref:glycosyltransferase family 4 protein n=1 Tax=Denitrificimonas caeni TaxID=521720 RepID=UPI0003B5A949|nr:glycosyltransferase family 4 protein [Denitrificimonas caeni]
MIVNAITSTGVAPSGWYRIGVLKSIFEAHGILINEIIPAVSSFPPMEKHKRPVWLIAALLERLTYLSLLKKTDITILQRELISTIPTVERFLPGKVILDVDDAIFLNKRGLAAINAAKSSVGVVCGNAYLAEYFSKYNANIKIIPTGVDVNKMMVNPRRLEEPKKKIIGWIGTPGNLKYFKPITTAICSVLKQMGDNVELRIITSHSSAIPVELRNVCNFVKWYPNIEFDELPTWTLGLMPLDDDPWTRGKCAFKMLQYMSAGIPVVVSPVGMNVDVLGFGQFGYGPETEDQWYEAIKILLENDSLNYQFGMTARSIAEREFSLESVVGKWLDVLEEWC